MALDRTLMLDHPKTRKGGRLTDLRWIDWNVEGESNLEWDGFLSDRYSHFDRFRQSNAEFLVFGVALRDLFAGVNDPDPLANFTADGNVKHQRLTSRHRTSPHIDNLKRASIALQHRRLCTTQTGFLCLAPDEVKIGDSIAILLGCNYPVLLRPFEDGYKYVGECYVDGMMNGEPVKAADHGKCKVEDTVLL
ncbi:hypothetical protein G6514_005773 [Epicoccum nigrum]|nr:hypothetical protein G6514_005773 [Epicoccum nigrum]